MSLSHEIRRRDDAVEVVLSGRIDRDAASALDDAYTAASVDTPESMQLDFTGVDYINSTGIALIVGMLARARAQPFVVGLHTCTAALQCTMSSTWVLMPPSPRSVGVFDLGVHGRACIHLT